MSAAGESGNWAENFPAHWWASENWFNADASSAIFKMACCCFSAGRCSSNFPDKPPALPGYGRAFQRISARMATLSEILATWPASRLSRTIWSRLVEAGSAASRSPAANLDLAQQINPLPVQGRREHLRINGIQHCQRAGIIFQRKLSLGGEQFSARHEFVLGVSLHGALKHAIGRLQIGENPGPVIRPAPLGERPPPASNHCAQPQRRIRIFFNQ